LGFHRVMQMKNFYSLTALVGLLLSSCSYFVPTPGEAPKSDSIFTSFSEKNWIRVNSHQSDADFAFQNKNTKSYIYVESLCHKYQDVPLNKLSAKLLNHFNNPEIQNQETFNYQKREALKTFARGKIDGVTVDLTVVNLKKNDCLYDLVMITPDNKTLTESRAQFEIFLKEVNIP